MALTIFFVVVVVRAALWCFSCFLRREAASRAGAGLYFVLCYFFEFGEPEPGRGASRFDCDSVWRVESLLPLVKPAMPVIWPAWILCSLLHRSFSVQSQVCLGTRRMSSDARRIFLLGSAVAKPRLRCQNRGDCRATTGSEIGSSSSQPTICRRALIGAAA